MLKTIKAYLVPSTEELSIVKNNVRNNYPSSSIVFNPKNWIWQRLQAWSKGFLRHEAILKHLKAPIVCKRGVFCFSIFLQLRWPIESKFPQVCYYTRMSGYTMWGYWYFDNYQKYTLPLRRYLLSKTISLLVLIFRGILKFVTNSFKNKKDSMTNVF